MENSAHISVLLTEGVDALSIRTDAVIVDATGGGGGHSARILERLGADGRLMIIDSDEKVVAALSLTFRDDARVQVVRGNFRHIEQILAAHKVSQVDGILADLGWNSEQFAESGKGFSFQKDEPLIMTYGPQDEYHFDAGDIVNQWSEEVIADVLYAYADERFARRIARRIVEVRKDNPIRTTFALVDVVKSALPARFRAGRIHPATKTFQALRIAVNDELDAVKEFLQASARVLVSGGRVAVITFHSIEDRIVKHTLRDMEATGLGMVLTKKPIIPSRHEIKANPRSRSAKLRIFQTS